MKEKKEKKRNGAQSGQGPRCALCSSDACYQGTDCFGIADEVLPLYEEEDLALARGAAAIEGRYYGRATRLEEMVLFAREMKYMRLGIAYCVGLKSEAKDIACFLERYGFEVFSVCCKVCGTDKSELALQHLHGEDRESMCNPIAQARLLDDANIDLAILCGLCVGHDILFSRYIKAPMTTLVVKDRVLAHNPVAAVTCPYVDKRPGNPLKDLDES